MQVGWLTLFGQQPEQVALEIERTPDRVRARRAGLRLAACWLALPLVALVPPHVPWIVIALLAGPYLARREWVGEYVVHGFEGRCPGCGQPMNLESGKAVRLPMQLDCPHCHRQSTLGLAGED